jgi:hypothetical protein
MRKLKPSAPKPKSMNEMARRAAKKYISGKRKK